MTTSSIRLALFALTGLGAQSALAQSSDLYVTSNQFGGTTLTTIRNGLGTGSTPIGALEDALAVTDDIRSFGAPSAIGGRQYSLSGVATGVTYANDPQTLWTDGTTDGQQYNYATSTENNIVYRFDRNWQTPTAIFTDDSFGHSGITYDLGHNSLWTYANTSGVLVEHSLTGEVLASFPVATNDLFGVLAYEPSSQTLWIALGGDYPVMRQYSRAGDLISSYQTGLENVYGMEFAMPGPSPAPGAVGVLGLAGLALGRRRR